MLACWSVSAHMHACQQGLVQGLKEKQLVRHLVKAFHVQLVQQ